MKLLSRLEAKVFPWLGDRPIRGEKKRAIRERRDSRSPGIVGPQAGFVGTVVYFNVQPQSTLVIPFPTPYVVNPDGGQACIGLYDQSIYADAGSSLDVLIVGLLN